MMSKNSLITHISHKLEKVGRDPDIATAPFFGLYLPMLLIYTWDEGNKCATLTGENMNQIDLTKDDIFLI